MLMLVSTFIFRYSILLSTSILRLNTLDTGDAQRRSKRLSITWNFSSHSCNNCAVVAENRERELEHNLGDLQVRYQADVENMARELELLKNKVPPSLHIHL